MKIYTGSGVGPIKGLGKHQVKLIEFLLRYQGWHSMHTDRLTQKIVQSLVERKVVEKSGDQYRYNDTRGVNQ